MEVEPPYRQSPYVATGLFAHSAFRVTKKILW